MGERNQGRRKAAFKGETNMIEFKDIDGYFIEIGARVIVPAELPEVQPYRGKTGTIQGVRYNGMLTVILDDGEEARIECWRVRQDRKAQD